MRRTFGLAAAGLVISTLLTSCTSSHTPRPLATSDSTVPSAVVPDPAAALVQSSDLPSVWMGVDHQTGQGAVNTDQVLAACIGSDPSLLGVPGRAAVDSQDFSAGGGNAQIQSALTFSSSARIAALAFANIAGPIAVGCFNQTFRRVLEGRIQPGATITSVTTVPLNAPHLLDETAASRTTVTVSPGPGQPPASAYIDFIFNRRGLITTLFFFENVRLPLNKDLELKVVTAVANRVGALAQA